MISVALWAAGFGSAIAICAFLFCALCSPTMIERSG